MSKHKGSTFDSFLSERGIKKEVHLRAKKSMKKVKRTPEPPVSRCAFCGLDAQRVGVLVSSPLAAICERCVVDAMYSIVSNKWPR